VSGTVTSALALLSAQRCSPSLDVSSYRLLPMLEEANTIDVNMRTEVQRRQLVSKGAFSTAASGMAGDRAVFV